MHDFMMNILYDVERDLGRKWGRSWKLWSSKHVEKGPACLELLLSPSAGWIDVHNTLIGQPCLHNTTRQGSFSTDTVMNPGNGKVRKACTVACNDSRSLTEITSDKLTRKILKSGQ